MAGLGRGMAAYGDRFIPECLKVSFRYRSSLKIALVVGGDIRHQLPVQSSNIPY
jgi:hypothetical protein